MPGTKQSGNRSEKRGHRMRSVVKLDSKTARMLAEYQEQYADGVDINEIAILAIRGYCRETPTAQAIITKANIKTVN